MAMKKLVDGEEITLTKEEEDIIKADWAALEEEKALQEQERSNAAEVEITCLKNCGLTNDAIAILKPELANYLEV